jgi:bacteriocin-like protein
MVGPSQSMQELSEDTLETINGGVISEKGKRVLITQVIQPAKLSGHSRAKTISYTSE